MDTSLNHLSLFAETPRAGSHGHRFLVAAETQVAEAQLADFLAAVQGEVVWGANFLGVSRVVPQTGTSLGEGREILVLAGVDVSRLSASTRKELERRLRELLEQLDELVRRVDWSQHLSNETVIRSAQLEEWLKKLKAELSLPTRSWQDGPLPLAAEGQFASEESPTYSRARRGGRWRHVVRAAVLLLLLIGLGILFLERLQHRSERSISHSDRSATWRDHHEKVREKIQKLAEEWHCTPEQVCRSLLRAADWDRRKEAETITLEAALWDGEVQSLLERIESERGVRRCLLSPSIDAEMDFRRFVESLSPDDLNKVREIRVWLYDAWKEWDELRNQLKQSQQILDKISELPRANESVLGDVILGIATCETDAGLGDGFQKPDTPLFDRQDVMIWGLLKQFHDILKTKGLLSNGHSTGLEGFLKDIKGDDKLIHEIATQEDRLVKAMIQSQLKNDAKSLRSDIISGFKNFVTHLTMFPPT